MALIVLIREHGNNYTTVEVKGLHTKYNTFGERQRNKRRSFHFLKTKYVYMENVSFI